MTSDSIPKPVTFTVADFARWGAAGGRTKARNRTPEQRRKDARRAAQARWKAVRKARRSSR